MEYEAIIMGLIMNGGDARSKSLQAMESVKTRHFEEAIRLLSEADESINRAHEIQTTLIQNEVRGEYTEVRLLMVHAQDHLMNAMTVRDIARSVIELFQTLI